MNTAPDLIHFLIPIALFLTALCLFFSLRAARRRRLIENIPTSKTAGVFIGLVELKGAAEVDRPLIGYLSEKPSVYYSWTVQEHWSRTVTETYTDSQGHTQTRTRHESGWTTVGQGSEQIPFYLQDDQGIIRIQPEGAKVEPQTVFNETCGPANPLYFGKGPAGAVPNSDFRRWFQESAIPIHAPIFVMGQSRERKDLVAPEIAADKNTPLFLISTRTEQQIESGLRWRFWLVGLLGLFFVVGGLLLRDGQQDREFQKLIGNYVLAGLGYFLVWQLGWAAMVYNSMVDLRNRVQQAWANVDVQLKRRNDLIPNLIHAVEGMRDHEKNLQAEVAHLRAQLLATPPGQMGVDHQACAPLIGAVIERYPELKANVSFLDLQKNLVDTEQRIALARGYFNQIATFYNIRLQIIPDRFLCSLGAMKPQALLTADQFERAPVTVQFAS